MKKLAFISFMILAVTACTAPQKSTMKPADANAAEETRVLLNLLQKNLDKGIMFGHQDDLCYGRSWHYPDGESDVKKVCSDYPAITGVELGHIELDSLCSLDSVPFKYITEVVNKVNAYGGIVTVSWHQNNPLTGGTSWDVSSDSVVMSILPGGVNHEKYVLWLERLAALLETFKDDNGKPIPVIFRPYHEHTGNWFWWGQDHCTPEQYITLWRFAFNYLCNTKGLHNLLFAYSPSGDFKNSNEYLEKYPGDEYVDILGFDSYQFADSLKQQFIDQVSSRLDTLTSIAEKHNKIPALTETGFEQIPDSTWWTGVVWPMIKDHRISHVLVWRNAEFKIHHYYAPYPGQKSEADFVKFYNMPETIFRNDIVR